MKYAIYDKAADGYLTSMEFDTDLPDNYTRYAFGYNEYITEARLLDTPKEAADAIARIESFKFMDKGRFVVHSFDDTLKDQYIISEAGTPTKVVDSITVDLDGTINVKYGTMPTHWSATSLDYAVNRMFKLQNAASEIYTHWHNTFDIYKAVHVIDERECTHYQFIKVTDKCLKEYAKNEEAKLVVGKELTDITGPLNKRIEELEAANNGLRNELYNSKRRIAELHSKVESIKKEARNWKSLYENADADREELKNVIDIIHTDLVSTTACNDLKDTLKAIYHNSGLDHISMENFLTAKDEICSIINHVITIMESRELNQNVAFSSAEEVDRAKKLANAIIDICEATTDPFEVTIKKFSQLYEAIWIPGNNDDTIIRAFKSVLFIFSKVESELEKVVEENVTWKNKAQKAEKALDDQKKLNDANKATIARMVVEKRTMNKELSDAADALEEVNDKNYALSDMLKEITDCIADIMVATKTIDNDKMITNLTDVSLKLGVKTIDDGPIYGISVISNILIRKIKEATEWKSRTEEVICRYKAKDKGYEILKNSEIARLTEERDKALERAEKFKGIANSVYGMTIPTRCFGKQMTADIVTGKKILVDKKKYDDLMECVNNIDLTYEMMKLTPFSMDRPSWLSGVINRINDLTK